MDYYLIDRRVVLTEEFVRRNDFSTSGLLSSDAALSRLVRVDPALSAVAITREQAADPPPLRDHEEFPSASRLTLGPAGPLAGFREKRLYRVLFARTPVAGPAAGGDLDEGGDRYRWEVRRIANGVAWCLDLTVHLNEGGALGSVLDRLTDEMRLGHGLIPVTTERFL